MKLSVKPKDCELSFFSGTGAGGQHRNKHMNCVRLHHAPSGVRTIGQDHREKDRNIGDAMMRLSRNPKFKFWAEQELKRMKGEQTIAQAVDEQMRPEYLQITTLQGEVL